MNLLELFSGTGSVGTIAKSLGYNVISLDLKMLILIVIYLNGTINSLINHTSHVSGHHPRALNTAKQKRQELGILNMLIV